MYNAALVWHLSRKRDNIFSDLHIIVWSLWHLSFSKINKNRFFWIFFFFGGGGGGGGGVHSLPVKLKLCTTLNTQTNHD